jgi:hypothetical protein
VAPVRAGGLLLAPPPTCIAAVAGGSREWPRRPVDHSRAGGLVQSRSASLWITWPDETMATPTQSVRIMASTWFPTGQSRLRPALSSAGSGAFRVFAPAAGLEPKGPRPCRARLRARIPSGAPGARPCWAARPARGCGPFKPVQKLFTRSVPGRFPARCPAPVFRHLDLGKRAGVLVESHRHNVACTSRAVLGADTK